MTGRSRVGNGLTTTAAYLLLGTWVLSYASVALGQVSPENARCLECHGHDTCARNSNCSAALCDCWRLSDSDFRHDRIGRRSTCWTGLATGRKRSTVDAGAPC